MDGVCLADWMGGWVWEDRWLEWMVASEQAQCSIYNEKHVFLTISNIKKRNGTDLDPFRGTEQQNKERFAMHAGTERKNPERFTDRNGTDRNGNGHISTPLASQKPMTSTIFMSRRDLQLFFF